MYSEGSVVALDERWIARVSQAVMRHDRGEAVGPFAASGSRSSSARKDAPRGVLVLPMMGLIEKRLSWLGELFGGCSTQQLIADVQAAVADSKVEGVVLLVDSPGGSVDGTEEAAAVIRAARERKPIVAVIDGLAASAGFWIAAQASSITLSPSGECGSIGVFSLLASMARRLDDEGIDINLIRRPAAKAETLPFIPLSDPAKAAAQRKVDDMYGRFVRDVARGRGVSEAYVESAYGQGRTVTSVDARRAGMVDAIAAPDEAIRLAVDYIGRVTGSRELRTHHHQLAAWELEAGCWPTLPRDESPIPFLKTPDEYELEARSELARLMVQEWEQSDREQRRF